MGVDQACHESFDKLKQDVASELVLWLPDFEKPVEDNTDAFDKAMTESLLTRGI